MKYFMWLPLLLLDLLLLIASIPLAFLPYFFLVYENKLPIVYRYYTRPGCK